ncbi:hypothetical protein [Sphingomonas sp. PAMC 26617]|uniref:hypothetical protein n=1 Tax=Sphingomonas sp. PAMC 26617 TaxID=1112216 RepID=UPI0002883B69|nr:hypothetical protein [Sphingomonas sp. PAMC 26617]
MSEGLKLRLYSFGNHLFDILAASADLEIMPNAFIRHENLAERFVDHDLVGGWYDEQDAIKAAGPAELG